MQEPDKRLQDVPDISSTLLGSLDYPKLDSLTDCHNQLKA